MLKKISSFIKNVKLSRTLLQEYKNESQIDYIDWDEIEPFSGEEAVVVVHDLQKNTLFSALKPELLYIFVIVWWEDAIEAIKVADYSKQKVYVLSMQEPENRMVFGKRTYNELRDLLFDIADNYATSFFGKSGLHVVQKVSNKEEFKKLTDEDWEFLFTTDKEGEV